MSIKRRHVLQLGAAGLAMPFVNFNPAYAQSGDTLKFANAAGKPRSCDPALTTQGADNWATEQMFEQLVRPEDGRFATADAEFVPTLATSWTNADGSRTWTFKLREGVQFHKGYGEMTSEDVVFSFDRARNGSNAAALFSNIDSVEATGKYEVVVKLKGPDALFLASNVFANQASIVSKKAVEEKGENFQFDPIGTGPYQLDVYDAEKGMKLGRFEDFWGEKAKIAKLDMQYIADTTARTLALLSGDVHMIEGVRAPGWVDSMTQRDPNLIFDMTVPGSFNTLHVNLTYDLFKDLRVRQALLYAMDRKAVAQGLAPMGEVTYTLNPPGFPSGFDHDDLPEDLRYDYNPEKAKALLAEAGYPNGIEFTANISQREDYSSIMLIVQEQFRAAGIKMNLNIMDHSAYHADNRSDKNTLALHSSSYPPIPMRIYLDYLSSKSEVKPDQKGGVNYSHYGVAIPGVDDLIEKAQQAGSYDEHVAICREIELKVQRDLPVLGVITLSYTVARSSKVDMGYPVTGGFARWRFHRATFV